MFIRCGSFEFKIGGCEPKPSIVWDRFRGYHTRKGIAAAMDGKRARWHVPQSELDAATISREAA